MSDNWQDSLLITDEPSNFENQIGRAYVLHVQPDNSFHAYCITRPFCWKDTGEWARRAYLCDHYFDFPIRSPDGIDPLISYGGDTESDTAFLIHDGNDCWFGETYLYESSKTIIDKILCVAKLEDALNHLRKTGKYPKFATISMGYTVFTNEKVSANVASGKWQCRSLLPYPFVVFANEMTKKVEVAKEALRESDGNMLSQFRHMYSIFHDVKIGGIKWAAKEKVGDDTTPDELEEITRLMLQMEENKEQGVFDIEHGDWQEQLAEIRNAKIDGTEFDVFKRSPILKRYEELESAYKKLNFDPTVMELGLILKMSGNKANADDKAPQDEEKRDPTKWGQTAEMLKAVVKGQASDPD